MDLWFYRYTLAPKRPLSALARPGRREGALLRVGDGFADVHPWPELGDLALDEQLAGLARGETTPLTAASLHHASVDGDARRRGVSLFDRLTIPLSHWPGPNPPDGFDTVKLKDATTIPDRVRIRIDFNATLDSEAFLSVAAALPHDRVDFIEDPCPYDEETWRMLRERSGLRLAYDRPSLRALSRPRTGERGPQKVPGQRRIAADYLIHKPAIQSLWPDFDNVVVTSYMDHPLGQFVAAYVAATRDVDPRCGLFTHVLYEPNEFIEAIESDGARLLPPRGTGLGFDELLARLPWKKLA